MASVRKHGKGWQVRGDGPDKTFHLKEDAQRERLERIRKRQLGPLYEAPPQTFGEVLDTYLARKKNELRRDSYQRLQQTQKHLEPLRNRSLPTLRAYEVDDLVAALGARRRSQLALELVKAVLKFARSRGQVIDASIIDLPAPRVQSRTSLYLNLEQLYQLASFLPDNVKNLVLAAGLTGLREGELFDLTDDDLDLENGEVHVRKGKTESSTRTVHCSAEAVRVVRAQLVARPPSAYVFPNQHGHRWHRNILLREHFKPAARAINMPDLVFHDLRRTYVTLNIRAGVDIRTIAAEIGHADGGALLLKRYGFLYSDAGKRAAKAMDELVREVGL